VAARSTALGLVRPMVGFRRRTPSAVWEGGKGRGQREASSSASKLPGEQPIDQHTLSHHSMKDQGRMPRALVAEESKVRPARPSLPFRHAGIRVKSVRDPGITPTIILILPVKSAFGSKPDHAPDHGREAKFRLMASIGKMLKLLYLSAYNLAQFLVWALVLCATIAILYNRGSDLGPEAFKAVWTTVGPLVKLGTGTPTDNVTLILKRLPLSQECSSGARSCCCCSSFVDPGDRARHDRVRGERHGHGPPGVRPLAHGLRHRGLPCVHVEPLAPRPLHRVERD
jgi:hypothetical protein